MKPHVVADLTAAEGTEAPREWLARLSSRGLELSAFLVAPAARVPEQPGVPLAALVPDTASYVRDAADGGLVGAAIARLRRAGPWTLARLGAIGLRHPIAAARKDFAVVAPILAELELSRLERVRPGRIVLAAAVTDLALAAGNRGLFASFIHHVRARRRAQAWFETANAGHLLQQVRRWRLEPDGVLMPLNAKGHGMKPDLATCLEEIRSTQAGIWARDITAGGTLGLDEALGFVESIGVEAVSVCFDELADRHATNGTKEGS
jgi:hypothetical protein